MKCVHLDFHTSPYIEGIGEKRKKKLLSTFDDIYEVIDASDDRLKSLGLPKDVIENLKEKLQSKM